MLFWHVPAPNEALLISGSRRKELDTQFRIVTGHGSFVLPIKQKARFLSLALQEAEIAEDCITTQGIRLHVRAIAAFKIGDDPASIANAARRFLSEQNNMEELVGRIFAGHLRSIIGSLTVEEIIRERDRLSQEVKDGSHGEMEKLGIVVDSLQIQEIEDSSGYINNIAAPFAAEVASKARIASAHADQAATQQEQAAQALKAEYERDTAIKKAGFNAETEQAMAAAAEGIKGSNLTVLNGSDGVNEVLTGVVAQGLTIYDTLRKSVAATSSSANADAGAAAGRPRADAPRTEVANGSTPEQQDTQKS
jgi:flotillin